MLQRCLSLVVILGLLALQLASMPHAHSGMSAADREQHLSVPHLHLDWISGNHCPATHSHGADEDQANSHEDAATHLHSDLPTGVFYGWSNHDANAIYCSGLKLAFKCERQELDLSTTAIATLDDSCAVQTQVPLIYQSNEFIRPWTELINRSYDPLYLKLCNFRI